MLKSLKVVEGQQTQTYVCVHWKAFPPFGAGEDPQTLRAGGVIDEAGYSRLQLWGRICGLTEMSPSKCLTCPHRRKIVWKTQGPVLVDPQGTETPIVDSATGEASPRHRHLHGIFRRPGTKGSHQTAAWTKDSDDG